MAVIVFSSLQNLKWLKIRYKYITCPSKVVVGYFCVDTSFFHCKIPFSKANDFYRHLVQLFSTEFIPLWVWGSRIGPTYLPACHKR